MSNFIHRILTYVANEFIVERLSNSRLFQQFVVKSNAKFKEGTSKIKAKAEDWTSPTSSASAQQMHARLHNTKSSLGSFGSTFLESVKKQLSEEFKKQMKSGPTRRR
jgi:HPt (histidine-containing phosphotransfer) domain-containing protein